MHTRTPKLRIAIIAGLAAGTISLHSANGEDLQRTALPVAGYTAPHGYVYINQGTGERVVSYEIPRSTTLRGAAWSWDNSVIDPCAPSQDEPLVAAIFNGILDAEAGDEGRIDSVNYWSDWFEAPADTIIHGFTFGYFTQVIDPGEDGVNGQEYFLVFTEQDRYSSQTTALAHSPVLISGLLGAEDDGAEGGLNASGQPILPGDGIIDFAEGNYWVYFIDFASFDTPTDIEVADTNGVSDGSFGPDSIFSGIPGADLSPVGGVGEGLMNCGFYIGMRQAGVAEGDGIINRFPELAGSGLENPDGLDIPSLANIVPMGLALVGPSADASSYDPATNPPYWPQAADYVPVAGEAIGSTDWFGLYDTLGLASGPFRFGGFECDPAATAAPFYLNPWSTPDIRFNVAPFIDPFGCGGDCPGVDFAEPFGVLDLADISAFLTYFMTQDPCADLAEPNGILDLADITAFLVSFQAGCP